MTDSDVDARRSEAIDEAELALWPRKLLIWTRLSGPGWLQGAITLGGGSLAGALYLGVIGGFDTLWVQPLAMILGVVMLAAVGYVALSTGQRPLASVNRHISPVLGVSWLLAVLIANHVWCLPQYTLAQAAVQQNLFPELRDSSVAPWVIGVIIFAFTATIIVFYDTGHRGIRLVEGVMKALVGLIVLAFVLVVALLFAKGALPVGRILAGFVPSVSSATQATPELQALIDATGDAGGFWQDRIAAMQRDRVIGAFGVAVGINMTFLLPYSLLKKGWGKRHRGLAIFDLGVGLVVPFVLATSCLVLASASQFHGQTRDVLDEAGRPLAGESAYYQALEARANATDVALPDDETEKRLVLDSLPQADHKVAAALVSRDADRLATTLSPLLGETVARYVFGVGVLMMALTTIIVLMLMNSFAVSEALGMPESRKARIAGAMMPGVLSLFAPVLWTGETRTALFIPANVTGASLIPIAYLTFFLMMNSRKLLGDARPTGAKRVLVNAAMLFSITVATIGCVWGLSGRGVWGQAGIALLVVLSVWGI
ncbi:MAG: divalent metal cation transporter, partial [Planctomycetota bacterium]